MPIRCTPSANCGFGLVQRATLDCGFIRRIEAVSSLGLNAPGMVWSQQRGNDRPAFAAQGGHLQERERSRLLKLTEASERSQEASACGA